MFFARHSLIITFSLSEVCFFFPERTLAEVFCVEGEDRRARVAHARVTRCESSNRSDDDDHDDDDDYDGYKNHHF